MSVGHGRVGRGEKRRIVEGCASFFNDPFDVGTSGDERRRGVVAML